MTERIDIELTTDNGARLDDRGDLATISDEQTTFNQRAVLRCINDALPFRGETLSDENIELLRSRLETTLANDDVLDTETRVRLKTVEGSDVTIEAIVGEDVVSVTV